MPDKDKIETWKVGGGHPRGWMPFELYEDDLSAADGAVDTLETEIFEPGYIYRITNISALDNTTQVANILSVGYVSGGLYKILSASKPAQFATEDWQGEIYLKEGDRIRAVFNTTTSGDDIYLLVNGVKIPIK